MYNFKGVVRIGLIEKGTFEQIGVNSINLAVQIKFAVVFSVLNCLIDKDFTNSSNGIAREYIAPSPSCRARITNSMVELVALSEAMASVACRCQPSHLPVLVDWCGDPLGVRIPSDSFMEWINEDNLKEFVESLPTQ